MVGPKTIRFSGSQFCFGIETLDNPAGKLFLGPEPVQKQWSMPPQHSGHFIHWVNLQAHSLDTSFIQKLSGPVGRGVRPEELKLFLQKVNLIYFRLYRSRSASRVSCLSVRFSGRLSSSLRVFVSTASRPCSCSSFTSWARTAQ